MTNVARTTLAKWTDALEPDEVRDTLAGATGDAPDERDQHTALLTMIQQQVQFPFPAWALGADVDVVDMLWSVDDEFGLDLACELGGRRYRVEAGSVELLPPLPTGHLVIAAYLDWKRRLGCGRRDDAG